MPSQETLLTAKMEHPPLDTLWYTRLKEYGSFEEYEYLDGERSAREQEKIDFIQNPDKESPNLDYPQLTLAGALQKEHGLLSLKRDILREEQNPMVRQSYRWKINEKIAEIRMLKATLEKNDRRFSRYASFIYGQPDQKTFLYTIKAIREKFQPFLSSTDPLLAKETAEFLAKLPHSLGDTSLPTPNVATFTTAQKGTLTEFDSLLNVPTIEGPLDTSGIQALFANALQQIEAEGWLVRVSDDKTAISVNQEDQAVVIPKNRTLSVLKARQLLLHEIGTHAKRRINGERSQLHLLGLGLDRYRNTEDGIATLREQVLEETFSDFSGLDGHLAISFAKGVDGKERNFREVFDLLFQYYFIPQLSKNIPENVAREKATSTAWTRCVRTFRGTTGKTRGACLTKDIIYREGNIKVWDVISQDSSEMFRFSIGKYDPSNERHLWILSQLEIQDSDLNALKEV